MAASNEMTASRVLVESLEKQGVERVFCVPGESYLGVLDALHDSSIDTVVARQEGGAAMMAEAEGKLTGLPGVVCVTRGPGATNASSGIHVAQQDSTPLIMIAGQVERSMRGKDAFQEIDFESVFGGMAKAVFELAHADEVAEVMEQAFEIALGGRPGPVVIAIPEDVCTETTTNTARERVPAPDRSVSDGDLAAFDTLLNSADRPIVLVGGSTWSDDSIVALRGFSERAGLPLSCVFRRQHLVDHEFDHYVGDFGIGVNPKLREALEQADLIVLLGTRFSEIPSQSYSLPPAGARVVHVHVDADELGRVHDAELMVCGDPGDLVRRSRAEADRTDYIVGLRAAYTTWSTLPDTSSFDMSDVLAVVEETFSGDVIVTNGAGNYSGWIHRFHRFRRFRDQVAPTSGSMGYGLPAAVAAKLRSPDRDVICFAGDGCFQMTSQEFGTATQAGAAVLVVVVDNGMYGTIRMHQEREYPERVHATSIQNPEFSQIATAYGAYGERVETKDELRPAFARALEATRAGRPALLHLVVDPRVISPALTLP